MSSDRNRQAFAAAVEAWNRGDPEGYLALYDPAIVHHGLAPQPFDQAANRAFYEMLWNGFPGARLVVDDTVAEGDRLRCASTSRASTPASSWGSHRRGGRSCSTARP